MFLRKLTVILVPLGMLLLLCLLLPLFSSLGSFFASLILGIGLGVLLALLLPLAGATRLREPFAWLLIFPALLILLEWRRAGLAAAAPFGRQRRAGHHGRGRLCRLYADLLCPHRQRNLMLPFPLGL